MFTNTLIKYPTNLIKFLYVTQTWETETPNINRVILGRAGFQKHIARFIPNQYVIVIENCQYPGYFTDKIVDCFAAGCIPIYWGNPKIKELFDSRGFYTWTTIRELGLILDHISNEDYESKRPYIEENFKRFPEFASPDRWMARNCYDLLNI